MRKKILAAGTFDLLHKGHQKFLQAAANLGDELHVIVARDKSVKRIKNFFPQESQEQRRENIQSLDCVTTAYIGEEKNFLDLPQKISPDIIALGYDQKEPKGLQEKFSQVEIIRLESYKPEKYKSSFFRKIRK